MIHSKLGKSKRLAAFACVLLLTLEVVAFPLTQAKAAATAALTAVGFGVTTAAFLSACGIYPYWVDDSSAVNFDWEEWVDDDLMVLVDEYNAANSTTPINPNQVSAFLSGATLLVGNYAWGKLCDFAEWIKTKYAVADNQAGVELGTEESAWEIAPVVSGYPSSGTNAQKCDWVIANGFPVQRYGTSVFDYYAVISSSGQPVYKVACGASGRINFGFASLGSYSFVLLYADYVSSYSSSQSSYNGIPFYYNWQNFTPLGTDSSNVMYPYFAELADLGRAITAGVPSEYQGIIADTTTVSIPDALPSDTEYGGLRVSGLPAATMAETVIDAVQDSVGERLKTPVEVVDVEIASGTEIDSETGAITQNPVVIEAPVQETIPALSALAPSQEFVAAMMEALQTKFPFCLPFDFMRVLQAFVKPPDAPVITMEFHDRMGGGTYTVTVDLEPWDDIAAVVRRLESMILFLGFWLNFDKFNVLNIILGQIG